MGGMDRFHLQRYLGESVRQQSAVWLKGSGHTRMVSGVGPGAGKVAPVRKTDIANDAGPNGNNRQLTRHQDNNLDDTMDIRILQLTLWKEPNRVRMCASCRSGYIFTRLRAAAFRSGVKRRFRSVRQSGKHHQQPRAPLGRSTSSNYRH